MRGLEHLHPRARELAEKWRDIVGFEGLYKISNYGIVKSAARPNQEKAIMDNHGYPKVHLFRDGKMYNRFLHRLIAEAFIPNSNGYPCVNHKDENPQNYTLSNLEWCTVAYNNAYGTKGKRANARRSIAVLVFPPQGEPVARYPSLSEAARALKISAAMVSECISGKRTITSGFAFERGA